MQAGVGLLIFDVMPIYMIIALDIVIITCFSINCPKVICLSTVCYFSREKPVVKSTTPKSLLYYICLHDLFLFAFIFRSIKPKIQKYLAAIYSIWRSIYQSTTIYLTSDCLSWGAVPRKGLTTPLTRRVASCCYLCAGDDYVVLLGYPTGSITLVSSLREIPTVVVLHHPFLFKG